MHFYKVSLLFLLFFPLIFIFTGWTVYHQTSERVTYKSSSKPRTRFLSGPVSLSICLYFFFSISPHLFPSSLYLTCLSLLSTIVLFISDIVDLLFHPPHRPHLTYITHFLFLPLAPSLSDLKGRFLYDFFFSDHHRISITCTH